MKILKKVMVLILFLFAISVLTKNNVKASTTSGHYTYEDNSDGTITITDYDNTEINDLVIPEIIDGKKVTKIGWLAFANKNLTGSLTISNNIVSIGSGAFWSCKELQKVAISDSVLNIGSNAFGCCYKLGEINVSTENSQYTSEDGILFNKDKTELIQFPAGKNMNDYMVPSGVIYIKNSSFEGCLNLTGKLTIPNTVTNIENFAFSRSNITSITIPESVESIEGNVFGCYQLEKIDVSNNNKNYTSEDGILFNKDKTELIAYPNAKDIDNYIIPNTVTTIVENAFSSRNSTIVTTGKLIVPESVTTIGFNSLPTTTTDIVFCGNAPTINNINSYSSTNKTIYYKKGTTGFDGEKWSELNKKEYDLKLEKDTYIFDDLDVKPIKIKLSEPLEDLLEVLEYSVDDENIAYFKELGNLIPKAIGTTRINVKVKYFDGSVKTISSDCIIKKLPSTTPSHYTYVENYDGTITITKYDGTSAKDLIIPDKIDGKTVTSIKYLAFATCNNLTGNITIPSTVTSIGNGAFWQCNELEKVIIPSNVLSIGEDVFGNCDKLIEINVSNDNSQYISQDGILFNKDKTELIQFPAGKNMNDYKIPNGVICIKKSSFEGCMKLTGNLSIPNTVTTIENFAFILSNITSITIPESVESIGDNVFGCYQLEKIDVSNNNKNYTSEGGILFNKDKTELIAYPNAKDIDNYIIPNTVTTIMEDAFAPRNSTIETTGKLIVPESVTAIGFNSLPTTTTDIVFCGNAPTINNINSYSSTNKTIYYKKGTTGFDGEKWSELNKKEYDLKLEKDTYIFDDLDVKPIKIKLSEPLEDLLEVLEYSVDDENIAYFKELGNLIPKAIGTTRINVKVKYFDGSVKTISSHCIVILPYPDVKEEDWSYPGIKYTYQKGIIKGHGDGTFRPTDNLTRAQVAIILYRMEGSPDVTVKNVFPDVQLDAWSAPAIQWAYENGIVTGYLDSGTFGPGDNITRQDLALMLMRYAKYKEKYDSSSLKNLTNFADYTNVSGYATDGMKWAVGNGIISGNNGGTTIDPFQNATRAQAATMIMRFCKNVLLWE